MTKILFFIFFICIFISCGKDTFQSKPQLFLTSVSTTTVQPLGDLQIIMRLTDKEGDFLDTIWVKKITTRCPPSNFADSNALRIPTDVPRNKNFDGEIEIFFTPNFGLQTFCTRPDTAVFSFWMKDEKGNVSDTVKTPPIIILK